MSQYWGTQVYSAHDRVPLRIWRCKHTLADGTSGGHACRQHVTHIGPHRCICGRSWDRTEAVSS